MTRLTEEQLQQYLDGTLGPEEKRRVEQILLVSPADREMLEEYRMLFGHLEEMSYKDMADILQLPEGTVKSYLFRGRKMLRERLAAAYTSEELQS